MDTTTSGMAPDERRAILRLGLLGAFVDGPRDEGEEPRLRALSSRLAVTWANNGEVDVAVAALRSRGSARFAFETALGACSADRLRSEGETLFLARLGGALGLSQPDIATAAATADALVTVPLPQGEDGPRPAASDLDRIVLNDAVDNGALARLPSPLAALAVIPLQMKLVFTIGSALGFLPDRQQTRALLSSTGAGLASQYLETVAWRLGVGETSGEGDDGSAAARFAFVTTFALGKAVRVHYSATKAGASSPRCDEFRAEGSALYAREAARIAERASALEARRLVQFVRTR